MTNKGSQEEDSEVIKELYQEASARIQQQIIELSANEKQRRERLAIMHEKATII